MMRKSRCLLLVSVMFSLLSYGPLKAQSPADEISGGSGGFSSGGLGSGGPGMGQGMPGGPGGLGTAKKSQADKYSSNQSVPHEIAKLPGHGIVGAKITASLGGVTIAEKTGMAIVLSTTPLVVVTTQDILLDQSQFPREAEMNFIIQTYIPVVGNGGMGYGGAGGMGLEGGYPGMGLEQNFAVTSTVFELPNEYDDESDMYFQLIKSEETPLVFGIDGIRKQSSGTRVFGNCAVANLTDKVEIDHSWKAFHWAPNETIPSNQGHSEELPLNGALLSPDGTSSIVSGSNIEHCYTRNEILKEYLTLYKKVSSKLDNTAVKEDPFGGPPSPPINNNDLPPSETIGYANRETSNESEMDEIRQAIVTAVVRVKSAKTDDERNVARKELEEILFAEFDARRTLKAQDIATLKSRLENLEKAEQSLIQQRERLIQQKLDSLMR